MVNKIELRKYATEQIASGKMSAQEAEDYMTRNGAPLQADYLQRVAKGQRSTGAGKSPDKPGQKEAIPEVIRQKLVQFCITLRLKRIHIQPTWIIGYTNALLHGTAEEARFKNGVGRRWYKKWLKQNSEVLTKAKARPLELVRAKWNTAKNLGLYYVNIAELVVQNGIGVWNPDFDPEVAYSPMVLITHPELFISYDETDGTLDTTADLTEVRAKQSAFPASVI